MAVSECVDHGKRSSRGGYAHSGTRARKGLPALLHRFVFLQKNGYLPPVVMHSCDNPRCINPDHLIAGDWSTNNKDRAAKGRSAKRRPEQRKLSFEQANEIRIRFAKRTLPMDRCNGVMAIARDYGVDPNTIYNIVEGRTHFVP